MNLHLNWLVRLPDQELCHSWHPIAWERKKFQATFPVCAMLTVHEKREPVVGGLFLPHCGEEGWRWFWVFLRNYLLEVVTPVSGGSVRCSETLAKLLCWACRRNGIVLAEACVMWAQSLVCCLLGVSCQQGAMMLIYLTSECWLWAHDMMWVTWSVPGCAPHCEVIVFLCI